jgi:uncharacterized protein YndB with AHSA1/START domain
MGTTGRAAAATGEAEQRILITRVLEAPRALVFESWTDPERMARWWGPKGFTTPVCRIDRRPGGVVHYCMRSPEGAEYWGRGVYREVSPERIVCTDAFSDADGNVVEPSRYGMSDSWPKEALITVALEERDGRTTLSLEHAVGSASDSDRDMCRQGWLETLDCLADYLADETRARTRAHALTAEFETRARQARAMVEGLSDAEWTTMTRAEQWPVGVTAHHLASAYQAVAAIVTAVASGQSLGAYGNLTAGRQAEMNAAHAREHANCTRAETLALLASGAAAASAAVRGLSDEQLDRSATIFQDAPPMTVQQMIMGALINHTDEHLASIRQAVGR